MSEPSLRAEIAQAISEGVGGADRIWEGDDETGVFVAGYDEPILIVDKPRPDVIIPDALSSLAPGIRLDVQAILAARS